jgi:hypothetical protein
MTGGRIIDGSLHCRTCKRAAQYSNQEESSSRPSSVSSFEKRGLTRTNKKKYMIADGNYRTIRYVDQSMRFGDNMFLVLLYGSKTWVLTRREENQLLVFERKVLVLSPCVSNVVKTSRLRHVDHMIRRPEERQFLSKDRKE